MPDQLLLSGATIVDGTGSEPYEGDVLVHQRHIVAVAPHIPHDGKEIVDVSGKVVAPGFVDVHSHSDNAPLYGPGDVAKVRQGITTEVVGNCGFSLAPSDNSPEVTAFLAQCFPRGGATYPSFESYFDAADRGGYVTNIAALVGEGNLRLLSEGSIEEMVRRVQEACDAGAFGLSTGLAYAPGMFGSAEETSQLVAAMPSGRVYATHMRNEGRRITDAISEAVQVAGDTGHPVQLSHLKIADRTRWGTASEMLDLVERHRKSGVQIGQDAYPYTTSSMMLSSCLPPWTHIGGVEAMLDRLRDPVTRRKIADEVLTGDSYIATAGYGGIRVGSTASGRYDHHTIADLAGDLDPFDVMARIIVEEHNVANMIASLIDEGDLESILRHGHTMIGSDGAPPGFGTAPHPRVSGTFVRVLGEFVRERQLFTLADAVRRMSALPAEFFGLSDRGLIAPGKVADLVIFDPDTVGDRATYDEPMLPPVGVEYVFVGGQRVVDGTTWTGVRAGERLVP